jgi:hypothetical protein
MRLTSRNHTPEDSSKAKTRSVLVINGGLGGRSGNTAVLLDRLVSHLSDCRMRRVNLASWGPALAISGRLAKFGNRLLADVDGFVFGTGTYWDSWGSPMQRFLEAMTRFEGGDIFLGKPAAVVVTMHSVGGKEVLSRLGGVLNTMGMWMPPMCGMVYSTVNHLLLRNGLGSDWAEDVWSLEDLAVIAHNLQQAMDGGRDWIGWPVDRKPPGRRWI